MQRLLIVKPSSLGDVVHTLPVLAQLRHLFPGADIRWLVNDTWAPLLCDHPLLSGVIEFPRQAMRGFGAVGRFRRWAAEHREWRPDLAIDVQGLLRSALMTRALDPRLSVGYDDSREGARFLHEVVVDTSRRASPHAVDRYLTVFEAMGWTAPELVRFPLPPGVEPCEGKSFPEKPVVLHPFSRGAGKSLGMAEVRRLVDALGDRPVVLVGRTDEARPVWPGHVIDLLNGTTLPELIWVLRRAGWVVSVDSGPMHLAAAITERTVALHSWSDPCKVGPYPGGARVWKRGRIRTAAEYRMGPEPDQGRGEAFTPGLVDDVAEFLATAG